MGRCQEQELTAEEEERQELTAVEEEMVQIGP